MLCKVNDQNTQAALVIIRTPFQAWLSERVIREEGIDVYDLLYFTQNDSEEDKYYFSLLKPSARRAEYFYVKPKNPDVFSHLVFRWMSRRWCTDCGYKKVLFASINAHVINAVAHAQDSAELVTFDDGAANIFKGGGYHQESNSLRMKMYRQFFGAKSLDDTKQRILKHYTIYKDFENIVDSKKLKLLPGWDGYCKSATQGRVKKYFIGAPFHEVMSNEQVKTLESYARQQNCDAYVRHPREYVALNIGIPSLNKKGRIAEEAIIDDAKGYDIELIGYLSGVMFTLALQAKKRTAYLPYGTEELETLARHSGCEVVIFK